MNMLQIDIDDFVGVGNASFNEVKRQLSTAKGKKVRAVINGYGGLVTDGVGIYNLLRGHDGDTETHIATWAFSADTIIAMGGKHRTMAENGFFMVHNPMGGVQGDASDMEDTASVLRMMQAQLIDIYARETKLGKKKIKEMMDAETWLSAKEALDLGFVHELTPGSKILNSFNPQKFLNHYKPEAPLLPENFQLQNPENMTPFEQFFNYFKNWFGNPEATTKDVQAALEQHGNLSELTASIRTEVETELTAQHTQAISDLQASHTTAIKAVQDQLDAANARIAELEKEPAAAPTNGPTGTEGAADEKPVSAFTANAVNRLQQKAGLPKW